MGSPSAPKAKTDNKPAAKGLANLSLALGTVLIVVVVGLLVWSDVKRNAVTVELFSVPGRYEKDGLSKEVITKRIIEAVKQEESSVKVSMRKANEALVLSTEKDILTEFEVPATKLSVRTAVTAVRKLLGADQRQLSGDIVLAPQCEKKNGSILPSQTPVKITIYLQPETGNIPPSTACVNEGKHEEAVIESASELILERLDPLLFAAYLGLTKHDHARSIELTNTLISQANQNDQGILSNYYNLRGAIHFSAHRSDELAISDFKEAIRRNPSRAAPHNNMGLVFARQAKYSDAIGEFKQAIAIHNNFPEAYNNLGLTLLLLDEWGNLEEAKADFQKAVQLDETFPQAYFNLGVALMDESDAPKNAASKAVIIDNAIANFALAEKFGLREGVLYYQWGDAYRSLGKTDDAIVKFQKADTSGFQDASLYKAWGAALLDNRQYPEATAKYRRAIGADPNDYISLDGLGMALYHSGKLNEAKRNYEKAIKLNPNPQSYYNLGIVLADERKLEDAKTEFNQALALDSSFANAYVGLGRVFNEEGRCEEALAEFQKALELDPNNSSAYNYSGVVLRQQGKVDDAIRHFRKAVDLDPHRAEFQHNLSLALQSQGKPK